MNSTQEPLVSNMRPPEAVMQLDRLGASHQTRLSFVRHLVRKMVAESWQIECARFDLDDDGYGTAIYEVAMPYGEHYSVVFFTQYLDDSRRTDRVIAEAWDMAFVLCAGRLDEPFIDELRREVPLQEAGRFSPRVLVLSRANKSTRNFAHVVDCLREGSQPDPLVFAKAGYLYRTTAVYGNGKFGIADYALLKGTRAFHETFLAQMFAVYMCRHFSLAQAEHIAYKRNPANAVTMRPDLARYVGVGNATGLGMAPFLVAHPLLIDQWIGTRERALALVLDRGIPSATLQQKCVALLARASQHVAEIYTTHPRQTAENGKMAQALPQVQAWLTEQATVPDLWQKLVAFVGQFGMETQEMVNAILLELYPALVNGLAGDFGTGREMRLYGEMPAFHLLTLIETHYAWALKIKFDDPLTQHYFWYSSAEKEEPRLGERYNEPGADQERFIGIGRAVQRCYKLLQTFVRDDESALVIDFLLQHPRQKGIVRRMQTMAAAPYGEVQSNLLADDCLPIHLLRAKLAMFGASKFDPKSNLWVRITLFQGAPLLAELGQGGEDDWFLPVMPAFSA